MKEEKAEVVANCDHLSRLSFYPAFPYAFKGRGVVMSASALKTPKGKEAGIFAVCAFVKLRKLLVILNLSALRSATEFLDI
jgi:hypothetical protein